ncbi:hypothetical protein F0U61_47860 [Archangium violaceum]|uniref:hypothetical protein n=1 Tax=Archangium violaceum TaxID=83451 RepID=UPI002B2AC301|nr:hypothetical protein F0U61_47860 [Archangium violaceum]
MKRLYKCLVGVLAGSALVGIAMGGAMAYTAGRPTASPAVDEAEQALAAIAAKHGTDPQSLLGELVENRLADRLPLKGGVNLVGEDVYVAPGEERNTLILGDQHERWMGAPRSKAELVVISGQTVLGSLPMPEGASLRNLSVIGFQPDKVFFLDGKEFSLGHLVRPKPE